MTTSPTLPLVEELPPDIDVVQAVRALSGQPRLILMDSALERRGVGRYSFLMADPIRVWQFDRPIFGWDPFTELRHEWTRWQAEPISGLPPFQGGMAGLLGYELGQSWERVTSAPCDEFELPVLAVGLYDWVIAWDHELRRAWIISNGWPEADTARRCDRAETRLREIRQRLFSPERPLIEAPLKIAERREFAEQYPLAGVSGVTSSFTRASYLRMVERAIEYIYSGDIFQVNLSQRLMAKAPCHTVELFERLRRVNPAPFAALVQWDDWSIISASPERFLRVDDGEVETRPIKGTRQRKRGPEADLFTRDELRESNKDQAENVMIVDLLRNDLSRVCQAGTIRVPSLCAVESYETVQHLVSEVRGQLQANLTFWDLMKATFPGGSITGAPKVRAMQIIAELEPTVRGPYCGSLFYLGFDGQVDSNLLIRTFVNRHGWLQCHVGGGIVAQSSPAAEYEETLTKAAGMLRAL